MNPAAIPHDQIPKTCACKWVPLGNGLWERTSEPLPGFAGCIFNHELAGLKRMTVPQLRRLARELGLSSITRLDKHGQLVSAIAKVMADRRAQSAKP